MAAMLPHDESKRSILKYSTDLQQHDRGMSSLSPIEEQVQRESIRAMDHQSLMGQQHHLIQSLMYFQKVAENGNTEIAHLRKQLSRKIADEENMDEEAVQLRQRLFGLEQQVCCFQCHIQSACLWVDMLYFSD